MGVSRTRTFLAVKTAVDTRSFQVYSTKFALSVLAATEAFILVTAEDVYASASSIFPKVVVPFLEDTVSKREPLANIVSQGLFSTRKSLPPCSFTFWPSDELVRHVTFDGSSTEFATGLGGISVVSSFVNLVATLRVVQEATRQYPNGISSLVSYRDKGLSKALGTILRQVEVVCSSLEDTSAMYLRSTYLGLYDQLLTFYFKKTGVPIPNEGI